LFLFNVKLNIKFHGRHAEFSSASLLLQQIPKQVWNDVALIKG